MEHIKNAQKKDLDCLLIFVPKLKNFYKPIGEHMFTVLLPMGLMSIADFVQKKGYQVQILHLGLEKINNPRFLLKQYLLETSPKVIGLSLHWHHQCYDTIEIAREIKEYNPDIFVVLGGLTASYFHEEILRSFSFIDGVIKGDGEIPFLELLENLSKKNRNLSNVQNLSWRNQKTIKINEITYVAQQEDLDNFNFTKFELLKNFQLYIRMGDSRGGRWLKGINAKILSKFGPPAYLPLLINKGCFVNCSYCGGSKFSQAATCGRRNVSIRSIGKVIESIIEAQEYGFKETYISYSPFNNYPNYFEELFETIKTKRIKMNYFLECWSLPSKSVLYAFNELHSEYSKLHIGISPECGSEHIRRLNKGLYYSNDELIASLRIIDSLDMPVLLYFSVGLPFETTRDIENTINFKKFLRKNFKSIISICTTNPVLEPDSPMFINPEKYDIIKTRYFFKDFIQSSKDINKEGFITPKLGYIQRGLCKPYKHLSEEESFRKSMQEIICNSSCRMAEFLFPNFLKSDSILIRRLIFICSRLICNTVSFCWKVACSSEK